MSNKKKKNSQSTMVDRNIEVLELAKLATKVKINLDKGNLVV